MTHLPRLLFALLALAGTASASPDNPWLDRLPLNQAHAGGDLEAPHSTMFAMKTAVAAGADQLEMDVRLSADGVLMVVHDDTVDRTTNGTGPVKAKTAAELQALDSAYWFVPSCWSCRDRDPSEYLLRGIRTGDRPPPPGFSADDFRIPTLREVLETFPDRLLDIEIKGDFPADVPAAHALADLLAEYGRTDDVLVVAFADGLVSAFKDRAPDVHTSPGLGETTEWFFDRTPLPAHKALQVPPTFGDIEVVTPQFVADAHAVGLAVHVWLNGNDEENDAFYSRLLDMGVDGIIVGKPALLQQTLERRGTVFRTPIAFAVGPLEVARRAVRLPVHCPVRAADRCAGRLAIQGTVRGVPLVFDEVDVSLRRGESVTLRLTIGRKARIRTWDDRALDATVTVTPHNADTAATVTPLELVR